MITITKKDLLIDISNNLSLNDMCKKYNYSFYNLKEKLKKFNIDINFRSRAKKICNPAKRKDVKEKISKTVKQCWEEGKYDTRINGMINKTKFKHHNYSPETEMKYRFHQYLSKFQDVNSCSICNSKKKIDVHHIDENHKNWLITNLEPLCVQCHKKFHLERLKQPYITIGKLFTIEACHNLYNYKGKCKRFHGHSYHLEIQIKKRINPDTGMVMDYGKLKEIVNKYVIEKLDHFYLNDIMSFNTTAENMIFWIWKELEIKGCVKGLKKIMLKETDNSVCILEDKDILEYEKNLLWKDKE